MSITPPVTITGAVFTDYSGTTDDVDVFAFTPSTTKLYTFMLSFDGAFDGVSYNNDLDMLGLINGVGEDSPIDAPYDGTTESFTATCNAGETQYLAISAFYTLDNPTTYTLVIE